MSGKCHLGGKPPTPFEAEGRRITPHYSEQGCIMLEIESNPINDSWLQGTWEDYLKFSQDTRLAKAKFYYFCHRIRIEMTPIGNDHSRDHSLLNHAIYLYAGLKNIALNGNDNCSYRQVGVREAQPDLSFYIGENAAAIPYGTTIIDLDSYPAPDLVIEIANTSLTDDLGEKRLLYEELGVKEYWVVNVQRCEIIAFKIVNRGSWRIETSEVLKGLSIVLLEEALRRTRSSNHTEVSRWLLTQFQEIYED
jgi:Uma2 family endonuclease